MQPSQIERLFDGAPARYEEEDHWLFRDFKAALNRGEIRAAEPDAASSTGWHVNTWVKKGILLGFRMGAIADMSVGRRAGSEAGEGSGLPFFDKSTYPVHAFTPTDGVRIVPGGSSIRDGSYIGRGVICMPPMFVNVGAYVGEGTMIDSHALVGSCAQIGRNCHISAGSQIGGVLEPVGAMPVIIEDEVLVGGNSGVYEGTVVKVRDKIYSASETEPLVIPEEAIVVPGSRAVSHPSGAKWGLSLQAAVIVKYRDSKTDARVQLEDLLR
jgi:2,3,4,5-tetrahydropyridine-2-carboxylate N-succinyltransferase